MLVGPVLGGVLLQFGDYPALGLVFAVLIALFALLTLCPVKSVKHDYAEKSKTGMWDPLETPGICLCTHRFFLPGPFVCNRRVEGAPFL